MSQATSSPHGLLARAEQIAGEFELSPEHVAKIARHFVQHMKDGLRSHGATQMPSYVTTMPTGTEKGLFLAVDLGGTNCRVCSVDLHGDSTYTLVQSKHSIPRELMVNSSHQPLFKFVAERVGDFLKKQHDVEPARDKRRGGEEANREGHLKLGFTFSFTYENESLSRGTMIQWDKGWDIPSALGRDPCEMLQTAIDELGLSVHVSALASDSVGTLMARSYTSTTKSSTLIGAIFGTGTNAAYVERMSNLTKLQSRPEFRSHGPDSIMIMNTEWGAFDEEMKALPTTIYDDLLDENSVNQKSQMLEKRISGLYLGELLRLVICQLLETGLLNMQLDADSPLMRAYAVDSSFLTLLAKDPTKSLNDAIRHISDTLRARQVSWEDARAFHLIAESIARRASRLSGAAIAAIIIQSERLDPATSRSVSKSSTPKLVEVAHREKRDNLDHPTDTAADVWHFINHLLRKLLRRLGLRRSNRPKNIPTPAPEVADSEVWEESVIDIGVDGSLFEFYPTFEENIRGALRDIPEIGIEGEKRVTMGLARDGSGVGAALIAQSIE
ncbi:putative glucokinase [Dactylonectria estremocensis]|uniref:Phosphotransferase n=1 Tax=Dactylonectria estremocensis TaxID=1079267 RepID=A0A9P9DJQ3_9HYPO|nr:putative glucokinase [Dactylonectria estremocensis]